MAQTKALVQLVKIKIDLVTSQKDQVQEALENYVQKMTSKARETLETERQDVNTLNEISASLEKLLNDLLHIGSQMADDSPVQETEATDLPSTQLSPSLSSLSNLSSPMLHKKSHGSESEEMSKLYHRIEALESGLTTCRNEMSQTTTQMTQAKDQLDTRCLRLEEKVQLLTNQNQETEMKQAVKFEAMDKKIEEYQRQSQENDQNLANLEKNAHKLDDVIKKVEEISTQINRHERSAVPAQVGFTAFFPDRLTPVPKQGSRITDFNSILCNEGNHFNHPTGEFICPIDGLYLVSASLSQWEDGLVNVHIKRQYVNTATPPKEVCRVGTSQAMTSSCGVAVVRLQKGDRVYVEVVTKVRNPKLSPYTSFSCLLIT